MSITGPSQPERVHNFVVTPASSQTTQVGGPQEQSDEDIDETRNSGQKDASELVAGFDPQTAETAVEDDESGEPIGVEETIDSVDFDCPITELPPAFSEATIFIHYQDAKFQ